MLVLGRVYFRNYLPFVDVYSYEQIEKCIVIMCRVILILEKYSVCYSPNKYTLPETNIAPENRPSQKESSSSNQWFSGASCLFQGG